MPANGRASRVIPYLLHLLLPGLGHVLVREYAFGLFVFLVTLLAVVLFFVSFLAPIPTLAEFILLGLPVVFYLFTFFDLARSMRKRHFVQGWSRRAWVLVVIGVAYQVLSPTGGVNFVIRNHPDLFILADTRFAPKYGEGEVMVTNPLAYKVNLAFVDRPFLTEMPARYDLVRVTDSHGRSRSGLVLGLPGENVQVIDGVVIVNGVPDPEQLQPLGSVLRGESPLTFVDEFSILLANIRLGAVVDVTVVPLANVDGEVSALF